METVDNEHNKVAAPLFDLTQDIIGGLPLKLIGRWRDGPQSRERALELLELYKVSGYIVSSDSAGLTKLTKEKGVLEILSLLNQPKEIVHGFGTLVGGQAVGIWAADNTQMFYPASVEAKTLVSMLLSVQDEIEKLCQIKIGFGVHHGDFFSLGGGLYGLGAERIEEIAENDTEGGEIAVSEIVASLLPDDFRLAKKASYPQPIGALFQILDGPRLSGTKLSSHTKYPIPYSESFYADLQVYGQRMNLGLGLTFGQKMTEQYVQKKTVVLIERETKSTDDYVLGMMMNLSLSASLKDIGVELISQSDGVEIKVVGPLGIYIFDNAVAAIDFARRFRGKLAAEGITCRIGIDTGPVLVFDLSGAGKDIAGAPINVASKMAQDKGKWGRLYLSPQVKSEELVDLTGFTEIRYIVAGVELTVYED